MSERLEWTPSEKDIETAPSIDFTCMLGRFALRPWNASEFTFKYYPAFNHIFHWRTPDTPWPEEYEASSGLYIPRQYIATHEYTEAYETMANYMLENDYPSHRNLLEVSSTDVRIIRSMMASDLNGIDHVPDDWV